MKTLAFFTPMLIFTLFVSAQKDGAADDGFAKKRVRLPNGWHLSPAGRSLPLGDLPLNLAVSSSKKWIAATNNGQGVQSLQLIDAAKEKVVDNIVIPASWYGLKFSADENFLYASGGNDNRILKYAIINNKLKLADSILLGKKWPEKISPAGIEIDDQAKILYVVCTQSRRSFRSALAARQRQRGGPQPTVGVRQTIQALLPCCSAVWVLVRAENRNPCGRGGFRQTGIKCRQRQPHT